MLRKKIFLLISAFVLLGGLLLYLTFDIGITGNFEGIFLLKGGRNSLFEIKDDLYLGDGSRYILGINLGSLKSCNDKKMAEKAPCLYYKWDEKDGSGFVKSFIPGGRQIFTSFSRYEYEEGPEDADKERRVHGLFVGGGLPASVSWENEVMGNDTGMAYFDGKRWFHLWCNVNEGLASGKTTRQVDPTRWKFLGSRVLHASDSALAIKSEHEAVIDGVPLLVEKFAYFKAGLPYFIMSIKITNVGDVPASYYYSYGDEPWVGNFGTSRGNVGWVADGLIKYVQYIDTKKYSYAGFFDYGNDANGSQHDFTNVANFIEWRSEYKPLVFFSNGPEDYPKDDEKKIPLSSDERFICIQWGPAVLMPEKTDRYVLAIGMAGYDPAAGLPLKPAVDLESLSK